MNAKMGGICGNVHIVLTDKDGKIKQEMTKKNTVTISFLWAMLGGNMYNNIRTSYNALNFASNTALPAGNLAADHSTGSALYALWNSVTWSALYNPTPSINPNPAEGNPYVSAAYYVAPGTGSGTIKTIFVSSYAGAWPSSPSNISSYVVFTPGEWIVKGSADALTVTWLWYFAGNYNDNWF